MFFSLLADIDECESSETNECDSNALCNNTDGSYVCRCKQGFEGDGRNCTGQYCHHLTVNICGDSFLHFKRFFITKKGDSDENTYTKLSLHSLCPVPPQPPSGFRITFLDPLSLLCLFHLRKCLCHLTLEATEWFFNTLIKQISQLAPLIKCHTFLCFSFFLVRWSLNVILLL